MGRVTASKMEERHEALHYNRNYKEQKSFQCVHH